MVRNMRKLRRRYVMPKPIEGSEKNLMNTVAFVTRRAGGIMWPLAFGYLMYKTIDNLSRWDTVVFSVIFVFLLLATLACFAIGVHLVRRNRENVESGIYDLSEKIMSMISTVRQEKGWEGHPEKEPKQIGEVIGSIRSYAERLKIPDPFNPHPVFEREEDSHEQANLS